MRTREGLILEDRYRLVRLIATGGMGQVWEGVDQDLERPCAIKILREEYAGDPGFLERFRAEARHTAALAHDAIAALYDYGEADGRAYIVMELVPGRPLADIIEENPDGLPERRVLDVLIQLARALEAAHAAGVVHRDVKPENILVDDENNWAVKITDFGIARSAEQARLTKSGLVMGTAQYLSPEQAMGKQATSLSDIYALGIVAFEILSGHRPFTGSSQVEIAMAQVKQKVPPLPDKVDPDLRTLVEMCLAKAPANRPRSAASVARVLESIRRGETPRFTTGSLPVSSPRDASRPAQSPARTAARPVPATSPTGTRTAAMPLPTADKPRNMRHRSVRRPVPVRGFSTSTSAKDRRALSSTHPASNPAHPAPTASTAPNQGAQRGTLARSGHASAQAQDTGRASSPAGPGATGNPQHSSLPPQTGTSDLCEASSPRPQGTSTGRRLGRWTFPGIVLVVLLVAAAVVGILTATRTISLGAPVPGAVTGTSVYASTSAIFSAPAPVAATTRSDDDQVMPGHRAAHRLRAISMDRLVTTPHGMRTEQHSE
ncbi:serine/threonine-protein kinase [Devriesea agamarum]|uniref:serine/threonine-protein kinase n=1 Tax=Devriesea agamarum TaxID=472569 RepID=UPI000A006778|nr:serine/threonine-protein kinase [Devriesea agamarum]